MTIAQLRAFEAIVATGGFGAAARMLGVSQPAVSARLAALERAHGVVLIDRAGGTPTAIGRSLHEATRALFAHEAAAEALLANAAGSGTGSLRVGADAPGHVMALLAGVR